MEALRAYVSNQRLNWTRQRETIASVFFELSGHPRVEDVLARVREVDPHISKGTVYRTMRLLRDCGLAEQHRFGGGEMRFEHAEDGDGQGHHDHLICTRCGRIEEFVEERIEALQRQEAARHGFEITHHVVELYGLCRECNAAASRRRSKE